MAARLTILSFLAVMASTAAAQETQPMTASDSDAVVRGAVRAALAIRADARPICVTYIADSLATQAGRTFISEGHAVAGMMRSADDSARHLGVTLLGLSGRGPAASPRYSAVNAPYVSGRRSRKNCHTLRTSRILSRSNSAVINSVLSRLPCATNCPRGSQK